MYSATGGGAGRPRSSRRQIASAAPSTTATVIALRSRFWARGRTRADTRPGTGSGGALRGGLARPRAPPLDGEPHAVARLVVLDAIDELAHQEYAPASRHQHARGMGGIADLAGVEAGAEVGHLHHDAAPRLHMDHHVHRAHRVEAVAAAGPGGQRPAQRAPQ